jgi:hypothetical protein
MGKVEENHVILGYGKKRAYVLMGARTSPKGEVRESKHAVEPGANSTGPCGRPHGRQRSQRLVTMRDEP